MRSDKYSKKGRNELYSTLSCIYAFTVFIQFLTVCLLFFTFNAYASDRPIQIKQYRDGMTYADKSHVSEAGQFKRSDDGVVKAYREEMSTSMAMPTGTACWFVLPDGTGIRVYKLLATCLLQTTDKAAELYWFDSSSPIANKVQKYDGYSFVDITTSGKRWLSLIVHLRTYLAQYLATILGFAALTLRVGKWMTFNPSPKWRWLAVKWGVGITVLLTTVCFFLVLVKLFRSETFLASVCFSIMTVGLVLYWQVIKIAQHRWATSNVQHSGNVDAQV